MLLFTLNLAATGTPAPTPAPKVHGFEMVGRKSARDYVRDAVLAQIPDVAPVKKQAKKQAKAIELKAAVLLAEGTTTGLAILQKQWLALKPVIPSDVNPSEAFWAMVAKKLREIEDDEEEALLLLL
jgi:hypothetical protein